MGNKTLAALSLWLLGFSAVYSQEIPIQLMLVDNAGFEKVNHNVKLRLTMSNDTSSTLGQYQEVHLTQSNEYGIISENIGSGVATTNSQVLSLEQFTFLTNEPIIKVELDTSSVSNQYYWILPYVVRACLRILLTIQISRSTLNTLIQRSLQEISTNHSMEIRVI